MKNMPTYEEFPTQNSALKKQVKCLGNQTEKAEKKYEQAQSEIKDLTLQNMANWMIKGANLLKPIYEEMRKELVSKNFIHADETPLEVLNEPGKAPASKSYMWVYKTWQFEGNPIVLYDYEVGRSGEFAKKFLSGFSGYLHCDCDFNYHLMQRYAKMCRENEPVA